MKDSRLRSSIRIVALYALVGGAWILASDRILGALVPDMRLYVLFSTYKGWFYVLITSLMLFFLMRYEDRKNQRLEERYQMLFEISPDPLLVADSGGKILEVNQRLSDAYGYPRQELLRLQVDDLILAGSSESWAEAQGCRHVEQRHRLKDGRLMDVEMRTGPLEWQGKPCFLCSIHDVTERRQAEAVLRESEAKFRRLVDANLIGVIVSQGDGLILQANAVFLAMTGYSQEDMPLNWRDLTPPEWREQDERAIERLRVSGEARPWEKEYFRKDGSRVPVLVGVSRLENSEDAIAFMVDLSERKAAEARVRDSLAEKEVLLREVHHRVKNNLQVIIALADLQSDKITNEMERKRLEELRQRVYAIASVHELLVSVDDLSSISAQGYVERITSNLYSAVGLENLDLKLSVEDIQIPLEQAVPFGLILNELLTNIFLHAFPAGNTIQNRKVWVGVQREDGQVLLEVGDNGVGLPADLDLAKVQTLGLRLVERLQHQLRARMVIVRGDGTLYRICFPVQVLPRVVPGPKEAPNDLS